MLARLCELDSDSPSPMRSVEECVRPLCGPTGPCVWVQERGWSLELSKQATTTSGYHCCFNLTHSLPSLQAMRMFSQVIGKQRPTWVSQVKGCLTRAAPCADSRGRGFRRDHFPAQGGHVLSSACDPSISITDSDTILLFYFENRILLCSPYWP